jgi:hypothetical protein
MPTGDFPSADFLFINKKPVTSAMTQFASLKEGGLTSTSIFIHNMLLKTSPDAYLNNPGNLTQEATEFKKYFVGRCTFPLSGQVL